MNNQESHKFSTLYGVASNEKIKQWDIRVELDDEGVPQIITTTGYVDGKKSDKIKKVSEGKNIGKKNETTPWEQAVSVAESKWTKQIDKGYCDDIDKTDVPIRPMLAHKYKERKHKIEWPCYVQRKLNGVRCVASGLDDAVLMMTRGGKYFQKTHHIREELKYLFQALKEQGFSDKLYIDGEIYKHGISLQKLGAVRKEKGETDEAAELGVEYHVYDCFDLNNEKWTYEERKSFLQELIAGYDFKYIVFVETVLVHSEEEAIEFYNQVIDEGYEGVMLRNRYSIYMVGHRSIDLQKLKPFESDEFVIVGAHSAQDTLNDKDGNAQYVVTVVWECITKDEKVFSCRPEGTVAKRKKYWENKDEYIGKPLTVDYQELSDDGIPIFPVGVVIRDYE